MKALTRIALSVLLPIFLAVGLCYGQNTAAQISDKGVEYGAQGRFKEAKEEFEKALKVDPLHDPAITSLKVIQDIIDQKIQNEAAVHSFKGSSYWGKGQLAEAIAEFSKAIEINPGYAQSYNERGIVYKELGEYDQAISDFNKAIEIDPSCVWAYVNRGRVYGDKGLFDQAISDFNKAIEINPSDAIAYNNRGIAYKEKGQYDKAISDYNKAIQINPRYAKAYYNRGLTYGKNKGQYDEAIADFNKAIQINPRYAKAYNNRGIAYMKSGNNESACSDWKRACELGNCSNYRTAKTRGICK